MTTFLESKQGNMAYKELLNDKGNKFLFMEYVIFQAEGLHIISLHPHHSPKKKLLSSSYFTHEGARGNGAERVEKWYRNDGTRNQTLLCLMPNYQVTSRNMKQSVTFPELAEFLGFQ